MLTHGEKMSKDSKDSKKNDVQPQAKPPMTKSKGRPQQAAPQKMVAPSGKELRGIVRIAGKDIKGDVPVSRAITKVKGMGLAMGFAVGKAVFKELALPEGSLIGELSEQQMQKLEHVMTHPAEYGVPLFMLNRRKDVSTGDNRHLISTDLMFTVSQDIEREKGIYTWKGYRHAYGQKVRGQRTRTTGRTGMTVGVLRKSVLAKAGGAATQATGAAAQAASAAPAGAAAKPAAGAKAPAGAAAPKAAAPAAAAKTEPKK